MKRKIYRCTLLSDVIINQKAATEGSQSTLDFIPGSNFLGIAAASLYRDDRLKPEEKMMVFHSGKVRFGDAHPSWQGKRSVRIPAAWFVPKLQDGRNLLLVHHHIDDFKEYQSVQPRQCRNGFVCIDETGKKVVGINPGKNFSLKSAYDRNLRHAKDEQMFGYQALDKGLEMVFGIYADDDVPDEILGYIDHSLTGTRRVGRSRTAQYGLVGISAAGEDAWEAYRPEAEDCPDGYVYVYADSRLIFMDGYGNPTYAPEASDFHLNGAVDWKKSQIRTFQYAPWNFKRQARDADRCGIEKGSVIAVRNASLADGFNGFAGLYQNEGFGKILLNPTFLQASDNGKCRYSFVREEGGTRRTDGGWRKEITDIIRLMDEKDPLCRYLARAKEQELIADKVYYMTCRFKERYGGVFGQLPPSQWGTIRSMAMHCPDKEELFSSIVKYLGHGVAVRNWEEKKRKDIFLKFLCGTISDRNLDIPSDQLGVFLKGELVGGLDGVDIRVAEGYVRGLSGRLFMPLVVTLASEMAKK